MAGSESAWQAKEVLEKVYGDLAGKESGSGRTSSCAGSMAEGANANGRNER